MKSSFLISALILFAASVSFAQKGKNEIGIGGEIAFPTGPFGETCKTGFGASAKFFNGVGKAGQVTVMIGYTSFSVKGSSSQTSASIGIIPLLLGYRFNLAGGFAFEPQAGYGSYHAKISTPQGSASDSKGAFTYAAGLAYVVNNIDFSVRYQNGTIEGDNYSNVALRIGYNFALKGK